MSMRILNQWIQIQRHFRQYAFGLGSSIALACFPVLIPRPALANFACGPNYQTYQVFDGNFSVHNGTGVRCVHFTNQSDRSQFIWYGEGFWGGFKYRHLGDSVHYLSPRAHAVDIFGNGENGQGVASSLKITTGLPPGSSTIPDIIYIGGDWNEFWLRMANGNVSSYTSTLFPIRACGTNLKTYSVYAPIDLSYYPNQSFIGVRCVLPDIRTWVGQGSRGNNPYFHIGSVIYDAGNPASVKFGAFDICKDSSFICNNYDFGTLTMIPQNVNFKYELLVQPWNEEWVPQNLNTLP